MRAYVKGTGIISPQSTRNGDWNFNEIIETSNNRFQCVEPNYSEYLNPVMARRMGRVIKMGIAAGMICLKDADLKMPDAIITGTALGCLGDTENFLKAIIADDEQYLTPTSFIQSIQNSVSAQIALHINCTGHNFTFVHKGFSFESALLDSLMLLHENEAEYVLAGGIDEMTDHNYFFYDKLGHWKKEKINSSQLFRQNSEGTIGGEGAAFFVLSKSPGPNDYALLLGVKTIYSPNSPVDIHFKIAELFSENNILDFQIDLILYGYNGDNRNDHWYDAVKEKYFNATPTGKFKHLCGEYQTSASFAMGLGCLILKHEKIPPIILEHKINQGKLSHILIYNIYDNNHSLILLKNV